MSDPVNLAARRADKTGDNSLMTPSDTLRQALQDIEDGTESPTAVLVLHLRSSDEDKSYDRGWYAANLKSSEMIALMEMIKMDLYRAMVGE